MEYGAGIWRGILMMVDDGGVCFPLMLKQHFDTVGFGWDARAAAFFILGCLILAYSLVRVVCHHPEAGQKIDSQIFDFAVFKDPVFALPAVPFPPPFFPNLIYGATFFCYWGLFTLFTFIASYAISYGMDDNLAFYPISMGMR
jgi:hypothetical protein